MPRKPKPPHGRKPRRAKSLYLSEVKMPATVRTPIIQNGNNPPADLAAAITAAPAGSTLDITGGSYTGSFTIPKALTLVGGEIQGRLFLTHTDITVQYLDIWGGTAPQQNGQIHSDGYDRIILDHVHSHDGGGRGVSIGHSADSQVIYCEIDHMDQLGYGHPYCTNLLFAHNNVHENNYLDNYSPGFEAGGGKAVYGQNNIFEYNDFWANHGPGMWDDIYCHGTVFRYNRCWQNTRSGIMEEVSYDAEAYGNVCWQNYYGQPRVWVQSCDILSHSSTGFYIHDNLCYLTDIGIGIDCQARNDWPLIHPTSNILVENNNIIETNALIAWGDDYLCPTCSIKELFDPANNNRELNNHYWKSAAEPTSNRFAWNSAWQSTLAAHESAGAGSGGSYLSTAEKDAILAAAGL